MKYITRIFGVLILLLLLTSCQSQTEKQALEYWNSEDNKASYTLENDTLRFEMDGTTSYFTLTDKRTGERWNAVPEGAQDDPLAAPVTRNTMLSTLSLSYTDNTGNTVSYDNYTYAIKEGTFRVVQEDDALRVDYMVGPNERTYLVPEVVPVERMEQLLAQMDETSKGVVLRTYRKLDPTKLKQDTLDTLKKLIPAIENGTVYALSSVTGGSELPDYQMEQLEQVFADIGYSQEDYKLDSANQETVSTAIQFNISIRYRLDGDALVTEIPEEMISYPTAYPMADIRLLPYFCAADKDDDGYLLVPDGGGAQIFFHNGKTAQNAYYEKVYGWDEAYDRDVRIQDTNAVFPVFGIARNDRSLLAIVSGGAGELSVEADVGGKWSDCDYVRAVFAIVHGEDTTVSAKSKNTVRVFQSDHPDETLSVRYICGESGSYVDMANRYREYLSQTYESFGNDQEQGVPLVVGLVGAIDKTEKNFGIPSRQTYAAATYAEATDIIRQLSGVENLRLQYSAVLNGGMDQSVLFNAKRVSCLGSERERQALLETAQQVGVPVYLGAYAQSVMNGAGFSAAHNAIRDTTNMTISRYPYSVNTQTVVDEAKNLVYLLNVQAQQRAMNKLAEEAQQWDGCISYMDVGKTLYSDFNRSDGASRDDMRAKQSALLAEQKAAGNSIMISGGNEYAAASASCIIELDVDGSGYDLVDRQIPFYQIALHGSVAYTGQALNACDNEEQLLLRSVETGAGLYYRFFETDYQELLYNSYTMFSSLYSANFADWQQKLTQTYERLNGELSQTAALRITDHRYLSDNVTCTQYEDGTCVYVNYGETSETCNGVSIPARDWVVRKGG